MKNMKLGTKEIRLILYLGGVIIALMVYEFVFVPRMDRNTTLSEENQKLEKDVNNLKTMQSKADEYKADTASLQKDISGMLAKFPAEVKPEDAILYSKNMQEAMSMPITTVGIGDAVLVYTYGEGSESTGTSTSGTTAASSQMTAEQDAATAAADQASTTSGTLSSGSSAAGSSSGEGSMLYKVPVSLSYTISYGNLKRCIGYIYSTTDRCSIDSVSLAYDTATGNLVGTMNLGMYYITGFDKTYTTPQIPGVGLGQTNLFGTVQ